jgi:hypothetical protein
MQDGIVNEIGIYKGTVLINADEVPRRRSPPARACCIGAYSNTIRTIGMRERPCPRWSSRYRHFLRLIQTEGLQASSFHRLSQWQSLNTPIQEAQSLSLSHCP